MSFGLLSEVLAVYGMEICHVKMLASSDVLWRSGFMQDLLHGSKKSPIIFCTITSIHKIILYLQIP
jgi:hypothetical protein